jgi:Holliday junction resolvasome RuvABC endonuclease subunit
MRILGIDPGLQRTGFGSGPPLARLHVGCADMSLHRSPCG